MACVEGECIGDNSGDTLVTDVVFHLVINVGVATRRWRLSWAGGFGEGGVVAAVCISAADLDRNGDEGGTGVGIQQVLQLSNYTMH